MLTYPLLLVFIQSNKMNTVKISNPFHDKNVGTLQPDCYCMLTCSLYMICDRAIVMWYNLMLFNTSIYAEFWKITHMVVPETI